MTIGTKRDYEIAKTPGPGDYDYVKADPLVYEHHREN
jgi:hypothetical protein